MFRAAAALLVLAAASQDIDDDSSMLQVRNAVSRSVEGEGADCALGPCEKPTIIVGKPPADDVDVEGPDDDDILDKACNHGTVLKFDPDKVATNNLGGMGPSSGDEIIQWNGVTKIDGKSVNLIAKAITSDDGDDYYKRQNDRDTVRWASTYRLSVKGTIADYNGVHQGVGGIFSMAKGKFDVKFNFEYEDGSAAVIPYLPLVFYDIDGGKETTGTNDAINAIVGQATTLGPCAEGDFDGYSFCHTSGESEVKEEGMDWDNLTPAQLAASVTYIFKGKSEFQIRYALSREHRVFLFKGSKAMVCKDQPPYPKVMVQLPTQPSQE